MGDFAAGGVIAPGARRYFEEGYCATDCVSRPGCSAARYGGCRIGRFGKGKTLCVAQLEPIDAYLKSDGIDAESTFLRAPLQQTILRGKTYGMPSDTAIRGLFWNMDELSAAGLPGNTGPRTWDDFAAFVQKLNRFDASGSPVQLGFVPWAGNWTWYGWLWTFGGDYFDPKAFAPHVNSPRDIQAFEWIASYAKSEGTLNALAALGFGKEWSPAGFLNGKTAMIVSYNYAFDSVKVPFNFFAGPMPYPAGGTNGTWPGGYAFVVPKGTPQSDAIARFLNYVVATDTQTRWYKETGALPSTLAALQMVLNQSTPMQRALLAQSASAHWRWPFTNIIHTVVNTAYRNVANLTVPPKQALDQAQQRLMADHPEIWGQI